MYEMCENTTIKSLPASARPRERLRYEGAGVLSNIELLAILLNTGSHNTNVLELSAKILTRFDTLRLLVDATVEELSEIRGVGLVKASKVKAALELAKRLSLETNAEQPQIKSPDDAASHVMERLRFQDREHFLTILLNTKNRVISIEEVSVGTLNSSSVHPREVFRSAIKRSAASMILVHNHPSGDTTPSDDDLEATQRICEAGRIIGIEVMDHIIIGDNTFISIKSEGLM